MLMCTLMCMHMHVHVCKHLCGYKYVLEKTAHTYSCTEIHTSVHPHTCAFTNTQAVHHRSTKTSFLLVPRRPLALKGFAIRQRGIRSFGLVSGCP